MPSQLEQAQEPIYSNVYNIDNVATIEEPESLPKPTNRNANRRRGKLITGPKKTPYSRPQAQKSASPKVVKNANNPTSLTKLDLGVAREDDENAW
ncbi:hypothetical protein VNI00_006471 [Paramarasmius palmivorus]|uniref:Uncharacterized protein n=1 Tax=Paramarasmius palmivorus TaxID=297713 RepID=A0AAW0D8W8_9AGAR